MSDQPPSHGLKLQARAIAAQVTATDRSTWLAGTTALREENEIQILRLDTGRDALRVAASYAFPSEIWSLVPSPINASQLAVVYNEGGSYKAALFSLPEDGQEVRLESELVGHEGHIKALDWHPNSTQLLTSIEDGFLRTWAIGKGGVQESGRAAAGSAYSFSAGALSRVDDSCCCTAGGSNIQLWDLRTMKRSAEREAAHRGTIRDVDFANKAGHLIASCGDDCRVKVWDARAFTTPLVDLASHAHWVWQAKFNPEHDTLLLTSSSDAVVNLLHLASLPTRGADPTRSPGPPRGASARDSVAASYDHHEDSVHGVAWSAADPWTFASLSYDGRVVVSQVSSNVKYKILI